jgi:hypothetical protein
MSFSTSKLDEMNREHWAFYELGAVCFSTLAVPDLGRG